MSYTADLGVSNGSPLLQLLTLYYTPLFHVVYIKINVKYNLKSGKIHSNLHNILLYFTPPCARRVNTQLAPSPSTAILPARVP